MTEKRAKNRWKLWLCCVAALLLLVAIGPLLFEIGESWLITQQLRMRLIEQSRTHDTALIATDDPYVRGTAIKMMSYLPPVTHSRNSLRFVAMPSFGVAYYALEMHLPDEMAAEATGLLLLFSPRDTTKVSTQSDFKMSASDYQSFMAHFDGLTDGWPGDDVLCTDGVPVAFERTRGPRITSGIGNCGPHYVELSNIVLNVLRANAPGDNLPTGSDWL